MKKLIIFLLLGLVACGDASPTNTSKADQVTARDYFCHYYKDKRTNTCFVGNAPKHLDHDHSHLSVVPCSDDVERLVEPWPKPAQ